jgi:AraC family transcriptional activator of pyochelin receptor
MKEYLPLDYSQIIPANTSVPFQTSTAEFTDFDVMDNEVGKMSMSCLTLPYMQVVKFDGEVRQNVHLKKQVEEETTVDTCVFLDGSVESEFMGFNGRIMMRKGYQNFVYQPWNVSDHYFTKQNLNVFHICVDRQYYSTLLSDQEKWSSELKDKLLNKLPIQGSTDNMQISPQMFNIVNDILNCPLSGNLRSIIIEAKIMEFIALQLNQMVKEDQAKGPQKMKAADRDALFALKEFLNKTFTKEHSLRTLSRSFGLNEFKLKRGFKELFGTTVFDYLHDLKMEYARQKLSGENVLINEVSGLVGYKNPNHFSTAFKRKYGINPAQLRR